MPAAIESLRLPDELAARVRRHARRAYPAEACGFLLGTFDGESGTPRAAVTGVRAERNRASRNDRFFIDATDVFRAMQAARRQSRAVLGVYHSHPDGGAEPSATDRDEAWGGWLHLIVSTDGAEADRMRCWIETDGAWSEVSIVAGGP